jgi:alkanesulfonate monooxygenase SsuD/methylene tetrahydromethanopterin reductase-like flavin-dependent oxidoreductase (luciferase family)
MPATPRLEFGYCPPSGERGAELIRPREFVADLHAVLDVAAQGFGSFWISDHLMFGPKYRLEGWTQLAWLAARYPAVRLGHMVLANSFRSPALLAKMAATLQVLSGGRFILAYGAGWHDEEYRGYGFDFPSTATRIAMLEEGLQVIRALWTQAPANFTGRFYRLEGAYCEPRPEPIPPILVGGSGERLTLRVVARQADWWNDLYRPPDVLRRKLDVLRGHCEAEGRDFAGLRKTVTIWTFLDRSHAKATRRAGDLLDGENAVIAGDPAAIRDRLAELAEIGFDMAMLVFPNFPETDDLRLFLDEVRPHFAG